MNPTANKARGFWCSKCKQHLPAEEFSPSHRENGRYCRPCHKEYRREYYLRNCEKLKAKQRDLLALRSPEERHRLHLRNFFGITPEQYDEMLASQGGQCAIGSCGRTANANGRRLGVDHDHRCCPGKKSCGKCIRGILCDRCNRVLGLGRDDASLFHALADYVG